MNRGDIKKFKTVVWDYYHAHGRDLAWRHEPLDAYAILVSEIMLQQTQVSRVIPKFTKFLDVFPTIHVLSEAPLADVLRAWSGLGYNRRAKYLHDAAKLLKTKQVWTLSDLIACKGIGYNTAAAIMTYAYNESILFIETNIRTVYIHHFFNQSIKVFDKDLLPILEATMDRERPREWHWALMDYGSFIKSSVGNAARRSEHYAKQPAFEGSERQVRGYVIKLLGTGPKGFEQLSVDIPDNRLKIILNGLVSDGLIECPKLDYMLAI